MQKVTTFYQKYVKKVLTNAYFHFVLVGVVILFLNLLKNNGVIKSSIIDEVANFLIFGIAALGFLILLGYGGLASLGTAVFIATGAFFTRWLMNMGIPPITTLLIVILLGVLIGIAIGFLSLRISGMYLAIITLVIGEILIELFKTVPLTPFTGGTGSARMPLHDLFFSIPLRTNVVIYIIAIIFVLILMFTYHFKKGPAGRAMLSMKNSESAAQTMGVNLLKYRILAFVISTAFAMISGYLYMLYNRMATINSFGLNKSLEILAAVVVGGTGSLWGLLIGVFLIFSTNGLILQNIDFFRLNPTFMLFINGILMIVVVLFYPGGMSQLIKKGQFKYALFKANLKEKRKIKVAKDSTIKEDSKHE